MLITKDSWEFEILTNAYFYPCNSLLSATFSLFKITTQEAEVYGPRIWIQTHTHWYRIKKITNELWIDFIKPKDKR